MAFEIGEKIRKVRELRGYSQDYMAQRLSISQKAYSNIENDKRKLDKDELGQIAKELGVDAITLLSFDEKILFNNCTKPGWYMMSNIYGLADKERDLYEKRIEELKEQISSLKENESFLKEMIKKG